MVDVYLFSFSWLEGKVTLNVYMEVKVNEMVDLIGWFVGFYMLWCCNSNKCIGGRVIG